MSDGGQLVHLSPDHLPRLMQIERRSFASPWQEGDFFYWFGFTGALCLGWAEVDELIAYALGYHRDQSFHLTSLAVVPERRRQGVAWTLLQRVLRRAADQGATRCTLEVRGINGAALQLYAKAGFRQTERRTGYYEDPPDDGIVMEIEIL